MTTLIRRYERMTVKLQELSIKSKLKVAMRYKNSKTVAMRYKNRMMLYGIKELIIQSVLLKVRLLDHKVLEGLFLSGHETILSKCIWTLKDNNKPSTIKWRIIKQCRFCNNISNKYNLHLQVFEKFVIIYRKNI